MRSGYQHLPLCYCTGQMFCVQPRRWQGDVGFGGYHRRQVQLLDFGQIVQAARLSKLSKQGVCFVGDAPEHHQQWSVNHWFVRRSLRIAA